MIDERGYIEDGEADSESQNPLGSSVQPNTVEFAMSHLLSSENTHRSLAIENEEPLSQEMAATFNVFAESISDPATPELGSRFGANNVGSNSKFSSSDDKQDNLDDLLALRNQAPNTDRLGDGGQAANESGNSFIENYEEIWGSYDSHFWSAGENYGDGFGRDMPEVVSGVARRDFRCGHSLEAKSSNLSSKALLGIGNGDKVHVVETLSQEEGEECPCEGKLEAGGQPESEGNNSVFSQLSAGSADPTPAHELQALVSASHEDCDETIAVAGDDGYTDDEPSLIAQFAVANFHSGSSSESIKAAANRALAAVRAVTGGSSNSSDSGDALVLSESLDPQSSLSGDRPARSHSVPVAADTKASFRHHTFTPALDPLVQSQPLPTKTDGRHVEALTPSQAIGAADLNTRFQTCLEDIMRSTTSPVQQRLILHERLAAVARDFIYISKLHARTIISEMHLPIEQKTIPPASIGGLAGGIKYLAGGILFKVASAESWVLYPTDEAAAKVAGLELKGLKCLFNFIFNRRAASVAQDERNLSIPLACVIDFRGCRCVCETLLPINAESLVCGTTDGGKTMLGLESTPEPFATRMREAAASINVSVHKCAPKGKPHINVTVAGPVDAEIHIGGDGRAYLIDMSRVLPPCAPMLPYPIRARGTHLYELHRPEFVARYSKGDSKFPLSSDALSSFTRDPERELDNAELDRAMKSLIGTSIPAAAVAWVNYIHEEWAKFSRQRKGPTMDDILSGNPYSAVSAIRLSESAYAVRCGEWADFMCQELCHLVHRHGVNLRFLGLIYSLLVHSKFSSSSLHPRSSLSAPYPNNSLSSPNSKNSGVRRLAADIILLEMLSRAIKVMHRRSLRFMQGRCLTVVEEPLLSATRDLCNLVFGSANQTSVQEFWRRMVARDTSAKFFGFTHSKVWTTVAPPYAPNPVGEICENKVLDAIPDISEGALLKYVHENMFGAMRALRNDHCLRGVASLVIYRRLVAVTGIKAAQHLTRELRSNPFSVFSRLTPFGHGSIRRIGMRVKSLNVVEHATGIVSTVYARRYLEAGNLEDAERLLRDAFNDFNSAIRGNPIAKVTFVHMAKVLEGLLRCRERRDTSAVTPKGSLWPLSIRIEELFESALAVDSTDGQTLVEFAEFLLTWRSRDASAIRRAEHMARKALELHGDVERARQLVRRIFKRTVG